MRIIPLSSYKVVLKHLEDHLILGHLPENFSIHLHFPVFTYLSSVFKFPVWKHCLQSVRLHWIHLPFLQVELSCFKSRTHGHLTMCKTCLPKDVCMNVHSSFISNSQKVEMNRWQNSSWTWSTFLSTDTSGIHLQTQKCLQNTSWDLTGVHDQWEGIYRTTKFSRMKELGGGGRSVNRPGPALGGWENWSRCPIPTWEQLSGSEEKYFRVRVKQLICGGLNGMRIRQSLPQSHTTDRDTGPLEGKAVGSWSLGIVEQPQGEGCCWLQRDGLIGCEGGDRVGNACAGTPGTMEAREYCWVNRGGWSHHHSLSLCIQQHRQMNNREAGPSSAWLTQLHCRTPPRVPLLSAWCTKIQNRTSAWGAPLYAWPTEQQGRSREGP